MSMSDYLEKKVLDVITNNGTLTSPANLYLALFKADPLEVGTSNEVSTSVDDTAYARQAITFGAAATPGGVATSTNTQTFPAVVYGSGAAPYTVTHIGIYDASSGTTNFLFSAALDASISRVVGKTLVFDTGSITITLG